ncbi:putative secreted protein [Candidatus Protochlamydia naegleriophila]|uniref:Putative secreted protein n=1 Tax=Candidatus Protochlamydia naegleriophila TaxID=389348 RepID=A0A0U5JHQ4_9BACT|nr:hypothetical protein [Candidatus Protochlamydia naegleriophila]CUI17334.1 putative secreted protein [Candidatus Protochlamydia naegleriophila]
MPSPAFFKTTYRKLILFWLAILLTFLVIYFFFPSLFNQMRESSYQDTPYINLPGSPA